MAKDRLTRGRPSKIEKLPEQVKFFLDAALRDNGTSQTDILAEVNKQLDALGEDAISRSGLNRYATQMERIGKKMRETNAVADAWVARLGDKPTGQVGNLLIQMTRSMAFDLALSAQEQENEDGEQEPVSLGMLKDLALTIQRLEKASMDSLKHEQEIRQQFLQEQRKKLEAMPNQGGVTEQTKEAIRQALGIV